MSDDNDGLTAVDADAGLAGHPANIESLRGVLAPDGERGLAATAFNIAQEALRDAYRIRGELSRARRAVADPARREFYQGKERPAVSPELATQTADKMSSAFTSGARKFDRAVEEVEEATRAAQNIIDGVLVDPRRNEVAQSSIAAEIREHVKNNSAQFSFVASAIEAGDVVTVRAVLGAPAFLSGLSTENAGILRGVAADKFAPEAVATLKGLAVVRAEIQRGAQALLQRFTEVVPRPSAKSAAGNAALDRLAQVV
jgi:hypothetical protein